MRNYLTGLALCLCLPFARAQHLEHFDVLLFSLTAQPDGLWKPAAPRFLTGFNKTGYNNQPAFFSSNELYLTVQTASDTTQTDIWALNLLLNTTTKVTATSTPEYSPTPMPDGRSFSAVRVEADGAQRLWAFPVNRTDNGRPLFPAIRNVGYHCWLNDTLAALFLVGDQDDAHSLAVVGTGRQKPQHIASNIGRCLQKLPNGRLAYVFKATEQTWYIRAYDLQSQLSTILVQTLPGSEDFAVLPDGTLLAGKDAKLYQYNPNKESNWKEIADLSRYGVRTITRLAAGANGRLALVVQ